MNVAIIPARIGSKRIPKKNMKNFHGKPIIAYSIQSAIETKLFRHVIVSTDSPELADIAISYGAEVPFLRPAELSDDFTGTDAVILHALYWLTDHEVEIQYVCCIYATAPLIDSHYIIKGLELLKEQNATSAFSVTTYPYPIYRSLKINENGRLEMLWPNHMNVRSQDLSDAYHDAGQFYWADTKKYLIEKNFFSQDAVPVVLPRYLVQDIDTDEDWQRAEAIYHSINLTKK
ncbi:MAG: pseudaminic acid cytidylyltransferase [Syntrophaceae bacterium]|nr:pseudaminic acid cytidylyltransferase [Syntrophaceae bacterium]